MTTSYFQINDRIINTLTNKIGRIYEVDFDFFYNVIYTILYDDNSIELVNGNNIILLRKQNVLQ